MINPLKIIAGAFGAGFLCSCAVIPTGSMDKCEPNSPQQLSPTSSLITFTKDAGKHRRQINVYVEHDPIPEGAQTRPNAQWSRVIVTEGRHTLKATPPLGHTTEEVYQQKVELYSPWVGTYSLIVPYANRPDAYSKISLSDTVFTWITESTITPVTTSVPRESSKQTTPKTLARPSPSSKPTVPKAAEPKPQRQSAPKPKLQPFRSKAERTATA